MVIANFTTKSGMKVTLEGNSEEVSETISEFERKEKKTEERRIFFEQMMKKRDHERNNIAHETRRSTGLTDYLVKFLEEGFFNQKRKIADVMKRFGEENIFPPTSTIHPLLGRLVLQEKLKREKNNDGIWEYFKL